MSRYEDRLSLRDQALLSRLYYGVLERRLTLDYVISEHSSVKLKKIHPVALELLRASRRAKLGSWEIGGDYLYFVIKLPDTATAQQLEAALDVAAEVADDKELEVTGARDEF